MIDFDFMEFYIKKRYNIRVEEYFNVTKGIVSKWRNIDLPDGRLNEFLVKEGSLDISELFSRLYK